MKKVKSTLVCIVFLVIIGGTVAFRANRLSPNVDTLSPSNRITSIIVGGQVCTTTIPKCILTALRTTPIGPPVNVSTTTTDAALTTLFYCETIAFTIRSRIALYGEQQPLPLMINRLILNYASQSRLNGSKLLVTTT